jgi:hypothetical protein
MSRIMEQTVKGLPKEAPCLTRNRQPSNFTFLLGRGNNPWDIMSLVSGNGHG